MSVNAGHENISQSAVFQIGQTGQPELGASVSCSHKLSIWDRLSKSLRRFCQSIGRDPEVDGHIYVESESWLP